ncbi:hypothetical protein FOPE_05133 [Fonsecaea pedrosoi]|nr:hypothetical protein FOPE_05133 [Fonsecaea pedrosoi]
MAHKEKEAEEEAEQENNASLEEPEPVADADLEAQGEKDTKPEHKEPNEDSAHAGQKRKDPPTDSSQSEADTKVPRQGPPRNTETAASPKQLLKFLLSGPAMPYCFPADELDDARRTAKGYKSYSLTSPASFTPFEHLLCAHMLSKPLSHTLGMRSIRTLLNEPFSLDTPEAIISAGEQGVWDALEAARTQHRQKTASYVFRTAELYSDSETMFQLAEEANDGGPHGVIEHIKSTVPGLAVTGGEIFCRRVQCVDGWGGAVWPYADSKALDAVRKVGIPVDDAEQLRAMIIDEVHRNKQLGDMGLHERKLNEEQLVEEQSDAQIQVAFVVALERALGCVLEGKVAGLQAAAAAANAVVA